MISVRDTATKTAIVKEGWYAQRVSTQGKILRAVKRLLQKSEAVLVWSMIQVNFVLFLC